MRNAEQCLELCFDATQHSAQCKETEAALKTAEEEVREYYISMMKFINAQCNSVHTEVKDMLPDWRTCIPEDGTDGEVNIEVALR